MNIQRMNLQSDKLGTGSSPAGPRDLRQIMLDLGSRPKQGPSRSCPILHS
jgi:hypothetical protein